MIGTIRKHSTWMWVIIIAAIIITFVYWGASPNRYDQGSGGPVNFGSINGERISQEQFYQARREVYLRYFFNYGDWPGQDARNMGFDVDRETYFRLLLIQKQKQLGIHVGSEAVARVAAEILRSFNRGNAVPLNVFVEQILARQGLTADDFERFVRRDLGIQQLMASAGLGGRLITPQEARWLYEYEHSELSTEAVFFSASNYLAGISATPAAVAQFYTNQMPNYRLPERVQVKYVGFPITNYTAEATALLTNLQEIVEAQYQKLGTNYFRDAKTPDEAKGKIRELVLKKAASDRAKKAASEFAQGLFAVEPMRPENLEAFAKTAGLTVHVSEPFDRDYGPDDLKVPPDFTKRAFALSADEPFAGPFVGEDAVFVIAEYKRLPSEIPALEKIRDRVTAGYKMSEAVKAAATAGEAFAVALTNGLAAGKTFSAICNATRVRPVSLPPFSLSTRALPEVEEHASLNEFKQAAFGLAPGQASGFVPTKDGGFVVFIREKLPVALAKMNADLPTFLRNMRQARQNEAFNDWFRKEAERGLRDTPVFRQPSQISGTPES